MKEKLHIYKYPRPAVTVDCVVFGFEENGLQLLLIRRGIAPFKGKWALPGGFVHIGETLDNAARRELAEEAGLAQIYLEQLYTFGDIARDPRERVISVAYYALTKSADHTTVASTDAVDARWFSVSSIPKLAFDHAKIIEVALERLRGKLSYQPIGFELLATQFTLSQLQCLYEVVLGKIIDKRNFRKKVLSLDLLIPLKQKQKIGAHRPAQLYKFDPNRYLRLQKKGFSFEI